MSKTGYGGLASFGQYPWFTGVPAERGFMKLERSGESFLRTREFFMKAIPNYITTGALERSRLNGFMIL